jgi:DNA-binding MarR family transcriptional regulator
MGLALGVGRSSTYSHLARLEAEGLLVRVAAYDGGGAVVVVTAAGARVAEELSGKAVVVPTVREASTARHGRAVSWVAASAELRGWGWLGPGDIREQPGWRLRQDDGTRHSPDLGIIRDGKRTAVEVELHAKAPARLRSILRGYKRLLQAGDLDAVTYVVSSERVAASVRRQATQAQLAGSLSVGPLDAIVRVAQERGRARSGNSLS